MWHQNSVSSFIIAVKHFLNQELHISYNFFFNIYPSRMAYFLNFDYSLLQDPNAIWLPADSVTLGSVPTESDAAEL